MTANSQLLMTTPKIIYNFSRGETYYESEQGQRRRGCMKRKQRQNITRKEKNRLKLVAVDMGDAERNESVRKVPKLREKWMIWFGQQFEVLEVNI